MKKYATLKTDKVNRLYELFDDNGQALLSGVLTKTSYLYERSAIFNELSNHGWSVEFPMDNGNWFMMSKEFSINKEEIS